MKNRSSTTDAFGGHSGFLFILPKTIHNPSPAQGVWSEACENPGNGDRRPMGNVATS